MLHFTLGDWMVIAALALAIPTLLVLGWLLGPPGDKGREEP